MAARLQAILGFPFQDAATGFASQSKPTNDLRAFFRQDDHYTNADSNAYILPTFLGNHDMGRFGFFVKNDNPGADQIGSTESPSQDRFRITPCDEGGAG